MEDNFSTDGSGYWFGDGSNALHLLCSLVLLLLLLHQLHLRSSGIRSRRLGTPALKWKLFLFFFFLVSEPGFHPKRTRRFPTRTGHFCSRFGAKSQPPLPPSPTLGPLIHWINLPRIFPKPVMAGLVLLPCESESRSVVSSSLQPHELYNPWNSPGQNTGAGSCSLVQGIFPTQGSNPGLQHCRQILYQLSQQGSPAGSFLPHVSGWAWVAGPSVPPASAKPGFLSITCYPHC